MAAMASHANIDTHTKYQWSCQAVCIAFEQVRLSVHIFTTMSASCVGRQVPAILWQFTHACNV